MSNVKITSTHANMATTNSVTTNSAHGIVLYGSQTGTAEDVAYKLHSTLKLLGYKMSIDIYSVEDIDINILPSYDFIIFIISTTGDGDMPDAAISLWKFLLRRNLSPDSLSGVKVAVFGLGDSSYPKYNASAR